MEWTRRADRRRIPGTLSYPLAARLLIFLPRWKPAAYFGIDAPQWANVLGFIALFSKVLVA